MGFEEGGPAQIQLAARGGEVGVALHVQQVVRMVPPDIVRVIHYDAHRLALLQSLLHTSPAV